MREPVRAALIEGWPLVRRLGIAYLLTDESFAMGIGWFRPGHRELAYYVTFGVGLWVAWLGMSARVRTGPVVARFDEIGSEAVRGCHTNGDPNGYPRRGA